MPSNKKRPSQKALSSKESRIKPNAANKKPSTTDKSIPILDEQNEDMEKSPEKQFPVVGIGASAGGLDTFKQLLELLPTNTGMAFIFIQHLAADHESALSEILCRTTQMPCAKASDNMLVEPNHVYVIPPNALLTISGSVLHLLPRPKSRGRHMPIDTFLVSLAEDKKDNAIGIIVSGTGSDGALGGRAVKAGGGIVFAQDEKTSKYNDMPLNAIATGSVDFILPPSKIVAELLRISRHPYLTLPKVEETAAAPVPEGEDDLKRILFMIRTVTGVDFTFYKRPTILRRMMRRMLLHKIEKTADYISYLSDNPPEVMSLFEEILINVSFFFRDPDAFTTLKSAVFPDIIANKTNDLPIKVWVPGCATGEEAYSIAICLLEFFEDKKTAHPIQIFATDIDEEAIERARKGFYTEGISMHVSPARLKRFFVKEDGGYRISKTVREMCVFARQDLVKDPPFSRMDIISCRNVLIYFGGVLQKKVIPIFHYALNPGGFLMLGKSEGIGNFSDLFSSVHQKVKIYSKRAMPTRLNLKAFVNEYCEGQTGTRKTVQDNLLSSSDIQREADSIIMGKYSPGGVVITDSMEIIQFRGNTRPYLDHTPGDASLNLIKMVRAELATDLHTAIYEARRSNLPVRKDELPVAYDDKLKYVNVEVIPFRPADTKEVYFLVLFEEPVSTGIADGLRASFSSPDKGIFEDNGNFELQQQFRATKEHLRTVIDEYEASKEEATALAEEMQSSNEELQSINEELETAKEELQASNQELTTVNDELTNSNRELAQISDDLANILGGVEIPIVLLGNDLLIRRFNVAAGKSLNLIPSDIGRPISDIRTNFAVKDLEQIISAVINTPATKELQIQDLAGRWYSLTIRPYKTLDKRIDGALLAIVDINELKLNALLLEEARDYAQAIVETVREPLVILSEDMRVMTANQSFYQTFGMTPDETKDELLCNLGNCAWNIPRLNELLRKILPKNTKFDDFEIDHEFPRIGRRMLLLNARQIKQELNKPGMILLAIEDVTERRKLEEQLHESNAALTAAQRLSHIGHWKFDGKTKKLIWSEELFRIFGLDPAKPAPTNTQHLMLYHPDDVATIKKAFKRTLNEGTPYAVESRILRPDGSLRYIEAKGEAIFNDHGKVTEVFGVCLDITERKLTEGKVIELNSALERYNDKLAAANKELEAFSYSVSHDLRSPLRHMTGFAKMLQKKLVDHPDEETHRYVAAIITASQKMDQLIDDLLSFSHIGRAALQMRKLSLNTLVTGVVREIREELQGRKIRWEIDELPDVLGDQSLLRLVIVNLVSNAIKFTSTRPEAEIRIGCKDDEDNFTCSISDNGVGFDMKYENRLFGVFQRLHTQEEFEGTGIGLANVQRIIARHGVKVWAEGAVGQGATFSFSLPKHKGA